MPWRVPRLQLSEKVVGIQPGVGIVVVLEGDVRSPGHTGGLYLLSDVGGLSLRLGCLLPFFRCRRDSLLRFLTFLYGCLGLSRLLFTCFPFCRLLIFRLFDLLTDSHPFAGPDQLWQICVEGVMRKSRQFNTAVAAVGAGCKRYAENFRCLLSVVTEHLIKVADPEYQYRVGMFLFHLLILLQQRFLSCLFRPFSDIPIFFFVGFLFFGRIVRWCQFRRIAFVAVNIETKTH